MSDTAVNSTAWERSPQAVLSHMWYVTSPSAPWFSRMRKTALT
jgi:hypothetical protein